MNGEFCLQSILVCFHLLLGGWSGMECGDEEVWLLGDIADRCLMPKAERPTYSLPPILSMGMNESPT